MSRRATNSRSKVPERVQRIRQTECVSVEISTPGSAICAQRVTPSPSNVVTPTKAIASPPSGTASPLDAPRAASPSVTTASCLPLQRATTCGQPSPSVCATLLEAGASVRRPSTVENSGLSNITVPLLEPSHRNFLNKFSLHLYRCYINTIPYRTINLISKTFRPFSDYFRRNSWRTMPRLDR